MGQAASSTRDVDCVIETVAEQDLDYDSMTKPPLPTDQKTDWGPFLMDSWCSPAVSAHMVSAPLVQRVLSATEIEALRTTATNDGYIPASMGPLQAEGVLAELARDLDRKLDPTAAPVFVKTSMFSTRLGTTVRPCRNGAEIVRSICDSTRCLAGLGTPGVAHSVWLLPWVEQCDTMYEFRVFVRHSRVVAMCPYFCSMKLDWLSPTVSAKVATGILQFWEVVRKDTNIKDAVWDVLWLPSGIKMIEFNPLFTSGGALFSWTRDAELLAGKRARPVMRIIV